MQKKEMEEESDDFKQWLISEPGNRQGKIALKLNQWVFWCSLEDLPEISLEWYARLLGVSSSYVSRCFRKEYKRSFQQVLNQRKIMEAKKLLRDEPKLSIRDIAEKVGYCTGNYFIKVFKKACGITPYQYRKQLKVVPRLDFNQVRLASEIQESINETISIITMGNIYEAVTVHGGTRKLRRNKKLRK
jgi:AraC-like DNA-binding protein